MPVTTSSSSSRSSKRARRGGAAAGAKGRTAANVQPAWTVVAIGLLLAAISASAIVFFYRHGFLLYYGDAASHINIARRIIDSRTPGWAQVGTAWLPLPHLLMVPFVASEFLWRTGLAGSMAGGLCFVVAGVFLFLAARRAFSDGAAAAAACLLFALNPNGLYLQAIPMTESVFAACLAGLLYFSVRFRDTQGWGALVGAGLAAAAGSLTRYEGWFLIPFATLYFLIAARKNRWATALAFGAVAALGPLYWLGHNLYYYKNALEFYNGSSSARAIQHGETYPGDHDWRKAELYVSAAIRLCLGQPLVIAGVAGAAIALLRRAVWPLILLALVPVFYVWSLHSGTVPIFVPHLWPTGAYYNTRYGIGALPLAAFAAAALVTIAPAGLRKVAAFILVLAAVMPWIAYPRMEGWTCWKESQVNSAARRAWTTEAVDYLRANYRAGEGILTTVGDAAAIYQKAGIPLRETLNECNGDAWNDLAAARDPIPTEKWAVAIAGDRVSQIIQRAGRSGPRYQVVKTIVVKGAPVVEIYHRQS